MVFVRSCIVHFRHGQQPPTIQASLRRRPPSSNDTTLHTHTMIRPPLPLSPRWHRRHQHQFYLPSIESLVIDDVSGDVGSDLHRGRAWTPQLHGHWFREQARAFSVGNGPAGPPPPSPNFPTDYYTGGHLNNLIGGKSPGGDMSSMSAARGYKLCAHFPRSSFVLCSGDNVTDQFFSL